MTTPIEDFNRKECCLIPAAKINAYTDLYLDPENPTGIILDTSWGEVKLNLESIVKAGETITHLTLTETGLCYEREDGEKEYISGDDLSRVISLQLLKDVDQATPPSDGIVYQYNETTNLFEPFDLKTFVDTTNHAITVINATLTQYGNRISALENKVTAIENAIPLWDTDKTTKLARGNINIYGDISNSMNKTDAIWTHDKNNNITNDLYFS